MRATLKYRIERTRTIHTGRVFSLVEKAVRYSDGHRSRLDILEHPGAVAMVPILPDGQILLIRQIRVATGGTLFEIPAGTREAGEPPSTTARRELIEETGYAAGTLRRIGGFFPAPGFCSEFIHLYLATDLKPARGIPDADERIEVVPVSRLRARTMIRSGLIRDAKSLIGLNAILKNPSGRETMVRS